ncbi:MAG: SMC-Scp complex subunit ScpB, partial [Sphaerochaetaceae bacterium]|nr:SMC-Scp complex subunit ScpB [Sphaerochaetaceae bacterium]
MKTLDNEIKLSKGAVKAFSFILHNQPVTRSSICDFMEIGASSISKYIVELINKKLIEEDGSQKSTVGSNPILYKISTNSYF